MDYYNIDFFIILWFDKEQMRGLFPGIIIILVFVSIVLSCGKQKEAAPKINEIITLTNLDLNGDGKSNESIRCFTVIKGNKSDGLVKIEFLIPDYMVDGSRYVETIHYPDGIPQKVSIKKNNILTITVKNRLSGKIKLYNYKVIKHSVLEIKKVP
ncbi:MAG: hypothetical protein AB1765_03065 [Candidatus Hydrogenedentota bacterium]